MSQLDLSIFYSHLITLIVLLYIFSHFAVVILINYYYNDKIRNIIEDKKEYHLNEASNIKILVKILE